MRNQRVNPQITIVGGGLAGVCAAIAAARLGRTVALINNRPVLGGNSSSEIRVWVCGATGHGAHHDAREGGIMGELFVENQFRNPEGNPYYWDLVVLEAVRAEPNITLYLNTDVREVVVDETGGRRITAVVGWTMGSEITTRFESPIFLDCSGDGLVGFLAGADYRIGRESAEEFGESFAPEASDDVTLGSTLLFYTKDTGQPSKYVAPSFAKDITKTTIPERRIIRAGDNGCAYWWIEWGGELDIVSDNERIRDELWSVIYGIWDYIKNSGRFDSETMTLEWIGAIPGKREHRRFIGDYTLTQEDVMSQVEFDDQVAFGGWSIDLHPSGGVYATEPGSKHRFSAGVYPVPYRCLYSRNIDNLIFAGRNISASHVAFGSTRVMATCASIGQGAGTAAALCIDRGVSPRGLALKHLDLLRRTLLRQDASVIGLAADDPADLAASATVTASAQRTTFSPARADERWRLDADLGILLPVDPALETVTVTVSTVAATMLRAELHDTGRGQNYVPARLVTGTEVDLPAGGAQPVTLALPWRPDAPGNAFLILRANPEVEVHLAAQRLPGEICFTRVAAPPDEGVPQPSQDWSERPLHRRSVALAVTPDTACYAPGTVIDGYQRPYAGPHLWASGPLEPGAPAWLCLRWDDPVTIAEIDVLLDDDVNEDLINLHHHRTPFDVFPSLLRDYSIEVSPDGAGWESVLEVRDNRARHHVHRLARPVSARALRLVAEATNGDPDAHVVSIKAFSA